MIAQASPIADIALVAYTRLADQGGMGLSRFPALYGWIQRVEGDLGLATALSAG